jgi:teichuronic acid biosynthesis glycosyltransferase TuaC
MTTPVLQSLTASLGTVSTIEASAAIARGPGSGPAQRPRVLVFTTLFPNPVQPRLGIFVRDRVVAVAAHCPTRVVAPVLTRLGLRHLERGSAASVPSRERHAGLLVDHPRFQTVPGVGRFADGMLLYLQTASHLQRLRAEFPFDVIDAHYAFPDGAAAVLLGRRFGVPVCVTLRGGDIDLLPRFRLRRQAIRWTLEHADRVLAVSEHLVRGAEQLGLAPGRARVVPNGIDGATFAPIDQRVARARLGITGKAPLVLCVGNLLAEKGQHVLIEALGWLDREGGGCAPALTIIGSDQWGSQAYKRSLTQRIAELGLGDRVSMIGSRPQADLALWYSAADLVVLPTFREGCPNVVREALACGTPVVASRVGGVPELITSAVVGLLVEAGDAVGLGKAIRAALQRSWDRGAIAAIGGQRSWASVAATMTAELGSLVQEDGQGCV